MSDIQMKNNCVLFYGNPAGYLTGKSAVCGSMFDCGELRDYLSENGYSAAFKDGIYDRLIHSNHEEESPVLLKDCRIYQIRADADVRKKFIGYDELTERFGSLESTDYAVVFDGEIGTENLEEIYSHFNLSIPNDFTGHSLSMSDVIELYNSADSNFYYVDKFGFQEVNFQSHITQGQCPQI